MKLIKQIYRSEWAVNGALITVGVGSIALGLITGKSAQFLDILSGFCIGIGVAGIAHHLITRELFRSIDRTIEILGQIKVEENN